MKYVKCCCSDDIKEKHKEIEGICMPIIQKVYGASGAGGAPEGDFAHDEL